jgi:type III pantothenate kinase
MWLGIDAGNSQVVLGVFGEGPKPVRSFRLSTHPVGTADELRARVQAVLAMSGLPGMLTLDDHIEVLLSSVVPAFTRVARQAFPQLRVIDSGWPFGFRIQTENPPQTGIDRLVNAEAALREGRSPAILIDSGTATTICALTSEPAFLGGAILPGLEACRDALPGRAAQLFAVELVAPEAAIGRGTEAALKSGVVLGYASMIDGMIERFRREFPRGPRPPRVIATGGASRLLRELCTGIDEWDPDLTLKGIAYLHASASRR